MRSFSERLKRRFAYEFLKGLQRLRILFYRTASLGTRIEGSPCRVQPLLCRGPGIFRFEVGVKIGYFPSPGFLQGICYLDCRSPSARIEIGEGSTLNNGFVAIAESCAIVIGKRVLIGPGVSIFDSDFHGLSVEDRNNPATISRGDVIIEDNVFIGARATILKKLRIGAGSVVAAGSVVIRDVPPNVVVAGNPAIVVRKL